MTIKKLIILLCIVVTTTTAFAVPAKTTKTIIDSTWGYSGSWDNGLPDTEKDSIFIRHTINATIYDSLVCGSQCKLIIENGGVLIVKNIVFLNGSRIWVKPGGKIIVLISCFNRNNSRDVTIDGELEVGNKLYNGEGSAISGSGEISAWVYDGECCICGFDPDSLTGGDIISDSNIIGNLPIELAFFEAECSNTGCTEIYWSTFSETDCDRYELFRSYDYLDWAIVTTIAGAGNSNILLDYSYSDCYGDHKKDIYYRLVQYDYYGKREEFYLVQSSCFKEESDIISVYPNPLPAGQKLKVQNQNGEDIQFRLYDLIGKEYNPDNLQPGIYNLQTEEQTMKLIVY